MSNKAVTADQRQALEAKYTWQRLVELRLNPVRGQFDATHLKEINRRIFQDLPKLGFTEVAPGGYRSPVVPGNDWMKTRKLETVGIRVHVAYSAMDEKARTRLDDILKGADPATFSKLPIQEFTKTIGRLYSELDYIHPFPDGNSRTLREFTRQLAEVSGYKLEWERFNQSPAGRDVLYIARDCNVNELALPHIQQDDTKRAVLLSMDQLEGNRDLASLLQDVITPLSEASRETQLTEANGSTSLLVSAGGMDEPSLEEQLTEQEGRSYFVKVAIETPVENQSKKNLSEEDYDEPGMDI